MLLRAFDLSGQTDDRIAGFTRVHRRTIQNLKAGRNVARHTMARVCTVLELDPTLVWNLWTGQATPAPVQNGTAVAPEDLGAYTRVATQAYIGSYLTIRADFSDPTCLVAFRTDITWDDAVPCLAFQEAERPDKSYCHQGRLYIPAATGFFHLVSLTCGALRAVLLTQIDRDGIMRGLITTLHAVDGHFVPVATPIVYVRRDEIDPADLGGIGPDHPRFAAYAQLIRRALEVGFVRLLMPKLGR
jgi:hypothetical protein